MIRVVFLPQKKVFAIFARIFSEHVDFLKISFVSYIFVSYIVSYVLNNFILLVFQSRILPNFTLYSGSERFSPCSSTITDTVT